VAEFYVYENWRAHGHVATIHHGTCSFCNFGRGMHVDSSPSNGRWHRGGSTVRHATHIAEGTGAERVKMCAFCF
jgi:hypothetical protein